MNSRPATPPNAAKYQFVSPVAFTLVGRYIPPRCRLPDGRCMNFFANILTGAWHVIQSIVMNPYVTIVVILLFGAAIFVHEFGHYWVARRRGLKVLEFAIGFGPKIFGWKRNGIEYSVRWIPAGGYVKLPQMFTSEVLEGGEQHGGETLPPVSPLSKILVAFAGPFMNVVFAFAIAAVITVVGLPIPVNPSIIGYVPPDSEEAKLGIQQGDQIVAIDGKRIKSWDQVQTTVVMARTNVLQVTLERAGQEQTYQLKAHVNELVGLKMLNLDPKEHPVVASVEPGHPAEQAGLKVNDRFQSFAGVPIFSQEQLVDVIGKRAGQTSEAVMERDQKRLTLVVTPKYDPETKRGRIGVRLTTPTIYEVQKPGPSPWAQVSEVWDMMANTFSALFHSKETGVGVKDLSGPVGIITMLAVQVSIDFRLALKFLVLLNINLAILNLLPIPVLDGGHIMMSVIEKIRRRPMSLRFMEYTTTAFAVLLISFMLYVTFFDFHRFTLFRSMFRTNPQVEETVKPSEPAASPVSTNR